MLKGTLYSELQMLHGGDGDAEPGEQMDGAE